MRDGERRIRLAAKLLNMTQAGELKWDSGNSADLEPEHELAEASEGYYAESGDLRFVIHQQRPRRYTSDITGTFDARGIERTQRLWSTRTILRVFSKRDGGEEIVTDVGDTPLLANLYRAARKSVTSIDADIEAFIGQEERHAERHHG